MSAAFLLLLTVFNAMTNDRPYHKAMHEAEAAKEIIACSGIFYDPKIVDIFYGIAKELNLI